MIEMLCALVEQQADIIRRLVMELEHERCLTEGEKQMVVGAEKKYSAILGADEWPDET